MNISLSSVNGRKRELGESSFQSPEIPSENLPMKEYSPSAPNGPRLLSQESMPIGASINLLHDSYPSNLNEVIVSVPGTAPNLGMGRIPSGALDQLNGNSMRCLYQDRLILSRFRAGTLTIKYLLSNLNKESFGASKKKRGLHLMSDFTQFALGLILFIAQLTGFWIIILIPMLINILFHMSILYSRYSSTENREEFNKIEMMPAVLEILTIVRLPNEGRNHIPGSPEHHVLHSRFCQLLEPNIPLPEQGHEPLLYHQRNSSSASPSRISCSSSKPPSSSTGPRVT